MIEFAPKTKSSFFKDFGARTAEAVKMYVPDFGTGSVLESRTREQGITNDSESHLDRLMYTVLQPIQAGLCKNISDYPGFNSFQYILSGKPLKVEFFKGSEFSRAKKRNKNADPAKYTEIYYITFKRLPGFEHMTQEEYRQMLLTEYERRRLLIIEQFEKKGHTWPSLSSLRKTRSTDTAKNPKRSERNSKRPLVLSLCMERRKEFLEYYFSILLKFKQASSLFIAGERNACFPEGTCAPPVLC